jgi:hypothetical protein
MQSSRRYSVHPNGNKSAVNYVTVLVRGVREPGSGADNPVARLTFGDSATDQFGGQEARQFLCLLLSP